MAELPAQLSRRHVLIGGTTGLLGAALLPAWNVAAQTGAAAKSDASTAWPGKLIAAARSQLGVTVRYDAAYTRLAFPGGDVPREKGVCTDVIVRAYRDAFGLDLQALMNADMRKSFSSYPKNWGLSRPDPSIDHRRVLNQRVFFERRGARLGPDPLTPEAFQPGDLATQRLPSNLPHIGIVSDRRGEGGRHLLIHNIGFGVQENDVLALFPLTGRYRFAPS